MASTRDRPEGPETTCGSQTIEDADGIKCVRIAPNRHTCWTRAPRKSWSAAQAGHPTRGSGPLRRSPNPALRKRDNRVVVHDVGVGDQPPEPE